MAQALLPNPLQNAAFRGDRKLPAWRRLGRTHEDNVQDGSIRLADLGRLARRPNKEAVCAVKGTVRRTAGNAPKSRRTTGTAIRRAPPQETESGKGRSYFNVTGFPFPLGPFFERKTIRYEIERGTIWAFEQEQALGFSSVSTNVRMTVIKLKTGGLWVHAPIAPTAECLQLLKELDAPVEHIVLPTFAYEHKIFMGPFSRRFPQARLWTAPKQWSWPLNLPLPFFGIFGAQDLRSDDPDSPWADEIEQKVFAAQNVGIGPYVETVFFHRSTRTLLVTDAVVLVPTQPPEVVTRGNLLASADNGVAVRALAGDIPVPDVDVQDNDFFRRRGWQRMVLQTLFLGPSGANLLDPEDSFRRVADRLIVSPILKTLIFSKCGAQAREWIDDIADSWAFRRIIPCHFAAPIAASPKDFKAAFAFLYSEEERKPSFFESLFKGKAQVYAPEDMKTLNGLDDLLVQLGAANKRS